MGCSTVFRKCFSIKVNFEALGQYCNNSNNNIDNNGNNNSDQIPKYQIPKVRLCVLQLKDMQSLYDVVQCCN